MYVNAEETTQGRPAGQRRGGGSTVPFWAQGGNRQPGPSSIPGGPIDPVSAPGNDPEISGILAGRLVDSFGRAPPAAFIQVVALGDAGAAPIEVETVNQGHFYIRGVQPGRTYRLVARSTRDGRTIAGETQARPPDTRLLIALSEDFVTSTTPAVPGPPQGLRPITNPRPTGVADAGGPEFPPIPNRPEQVAETDSPRPAIANVPAPDASAPSWNQGALAPNAPTFTPAVLVSANKVQYLALQDVDGRPWDLSQRRGRLLLIDLWGTWCQPCLQAIPELIRLQSSYGPRGLEVIGVACERGSPADSVRRVQDIRKKIPSLNYRLLLGDDGNHKPVETQFRVAAYPTLVLVDADGTILWRGEGGDSIRELEQIIRRRLAY